MINDGFYLVREVPSTSHSLQFWSPLAAIHPPVRSSKARLVAPSWSGLGGVLILSHFDSGPSLQDQWIDLLGGVYYRSAKYLPQNLHDYLWPRCLKHCHFLSCVVCELEIQNELQEVSCHGWSFAPIAFPESCNSLHLWYNRPPLRRQFLE